MPGHMHAHHFMPHHFMMPWFLIGPSIMQLLLLASTIFWIWAMVDSVRNSRISGTARVVWLLVILFTHWLGAVCYFIFGRSPQPQTRYYQPPVYQHNYQAAHYYQPQQPVYYQSAPVRDVEYREYNQGYRPQERLQEHPQERPSSQERLTAWERYEEPQALYPEMPHQQQ